MGQTHTQPTEPMEFATQIEDLSMNVTEDAKKQEEEAVAVAAARAVADAPPLAEEAPVAEAPLFAAEAPVFAGETPVLAAEEVGISSAPRCFPPLRVASVTSSASVS